MFNLSYTHTLHTVYSWSLQWEEGGAKSLSANFFFINISIDAQCINLIKYILYIYYLSIYICIFIYHFPFIKNVSSSTSYKKSQSFRLYIFLSLREFEKIRSFAIFYFYYIYNLNLRSCRQLLSLFNYVPFHLLYISLHIYLFTNLSIKLASLI